MHMTLSLEMFLIYCREYNFHGTFDEALVEFSSRGWWERERFIVMARQEVAYKRRMVKVCGEYPAVTGQRQVSV